MTLALILLAAWILCALGYLALCRSAARGDRRLREAMNQPRDARTGLRRLK
jgi:hypothetical protein